jgi:hypothetical protein
MRAENAPSSAIDQTKVVSLHPSITHVLEYFKYLHLPQHLQDVSMPFSELAYKVAWRAPNNPETTVALRKLLEAKDAAVRAAL